MNRLRRKHLLPTTAMARRGTLLLEAVVGAILLGAAISMLVPAMSAVRHQRQSFRFESLAMVELNNIDDALPAALSAERLPQLSSWFQKRYANATLKAELLPMSTDDGAKELQAMRLTILRPTFESMPAQKISLVVWRPVQETTP